jgi:2',3'-cyclic-nucleotide 2'-phosphodiesterase (5'-nucleotidase family)
MNKNKLFTIMIMFLLFGCDDFVSSTDNDYFSLQAKNKKYESIKLVFSHNINGETHPCGCRKFPLGGLIQVSSYMHELAKSSPVLYVDSGDMLFTSTVIPESLSKSIHFTAQKIIEAQEQIGLKLFTPGDQDFASGKQYLANVSKDSKFSFLISNLKNDSKIKHIQERIINLGKRKLLFMGIMNPSLFDKNSSLFTNPADSIKKIIKSHSKEKNITYIVLSHSGMNFDKKLAKEIPSIDLIIGAHDQAFLKDAAKIGKTKIVQVLSRNHYLGVIDIPLAPEKEMTYKLIAMDDEKKELWKENPFNQWLGDYKTQLDKIHEKESNSMDKSFSGETKAPTYASCLECHSAQTRHWQSTAHATSFYTLIQAKASNNKACIGCHSLKFQDKAGFTSKSNIVRTPEHIKLDADAYWSEVESAFKSVKSIRNLSAKKREELSKAWQKIDKKHQIEYNNANVQCLNCHDKAFDHPFTMNEKKPRKIENACYKCHTPDQSPSWYKGEDGHGGGKFNPAIIKEKLKLISCPKS